MNPPDGHVFWLFGLSGSGKSTLAELLAASLRAEGNAVLAIDGDLLRAGLCRELGFSDADRAENLRRAAEIAKLGIQSGCLVVASFITPREANRDQIGNIIGRDRLSLVFLDASFDVCRQRDIKGLYARARDGLIPDMTGFQSAFEIPQHAHLNLKTGVQTVAESSAQLTSYARAIRTILPVQPGDLSTNPGSLPRGDSEVGVAI